jgi:hypothetical protein
MTERNLIQAPSPVQEATCLACERLERERTTDARALLAIARRCGCGGVTRETISKLTAHAVEDVRLGALARAARIQWARLALAPWT